MKLSELIERIRQGEEAAGAVLIEEERPPNAPGGADRRVVLLDPKGEQVVIGRSAQANLRIREDNVSSRHAALVPPKRSQGAWGLVDLASTNGTKIDGEQLKPKTPRPLLVGQQLLFGPKALFTFLDRAGLEELVEEAGGLSPEAKAAEAPQTDPAPRRPSSRQRAEGPDPARRRASSRQRAEAPETDPARRRPSSRQREEAPETDPAPRRPSRQREEAPETDPAPRRASSKQLTLGKKLLVQLLGEAREHNASDLHLLTDSPPVMRLNGELKRRRKPILGRNEMDALVEVVTTPDQRAAFEESGDLDLCCNVAGGRYRVNVCLHREGIAVSLRVVSDRIPELDELGIPSSARGLTDFAQGLVLITGPLGAGKTTTMLALVDLVNRSRPDHIITIEDPIEFLITPQQCQISQRELHTHTKSFGAALRGALREDPDIIMIGDLRDYDTAHLAIGAAETGHLVFASMATMNATKSIEKLIDLFPADEQAATRTMLSESLRGILCQHLLPGTAGARVPAVELVFNSIAVANIIREGKTSNLKNAMQMGRAQGMLSLETSLEELVKAKRITREVADATLRG